MIKGETKRRLAAVMFTDIVGYTALMQQNEPKGAAVRARHRQVFDRQHQAHHGQILQYFGDGTLSVFQSGVEAVECALAIQQALNTGDIVPLRIGLHSGDIVFDGTEIYGDGVNLASRIESMGVAGGILLSGKLHDDLKNQPHISTQLLGAFEFKNVPDPVDVFAVSNPGIRVPARSELRGKTKTTANSIAVLPFVNMSADENNEYLSDGMTEEIINALSKVRNLKVTSRTSSFFFKNKNVPIPEIGRELNVSTILEGSIRLAGNRMRITAQLIDVASDHHFWSENFDRSIEDIFAVQDEISLLIAEKLRKHIGHFELEAHLVQAPAIPVDTYMRYLKGRYHLLKMIKSDIDFGMSLLEALIEEHPRFAPAYLGVHMGYVLLGTIGLVPAREAFAKGKPFLDRAIELDPELPECQLQLAWICFLQEWDFAAAYRHLHKSREIRPIVDFYQTMASTLVAEAKHAAAMNYIETALQIDPLSAVNYHLKGFIFYVQEQFEKAIQWFTKSIEMKGNFTISTLYRGQALLCAGRPEEGLDFFRRLPPDEPGDIVKLGGMTLAHSAVGNASEAAAGIEKLDAVLDTNLMERAMIMLILCQTMLGNHEKALQLFARGIDLHLPMMVYLPVEPILKPLHQDARFSHLVQRILGKSSGFTFGAKAYKQSLFSPEELESYKQQLEQLMMSDKPYLDPGLNLNTLAELLEIPANHLSQLLNKGFDRNFSEFVNSYRLEAFKQKAADPTLQQLTLLALAYESGFNSKTVFNTFFKKSMGMTPSTYWKQLVRS